MILASVASSYIARCTFVAGIFLLILLCCVWMYMYAPIVFFVSIVALIVSFILCTPSLPTPPLSAHKTLDSLGVYPLNRSPEELNCMEEEEEEVLDLEDYDSDEQFEMEFRFHKDYYYKEKMNYTKVTS